MKEDQGPDLVAKIGAWSATIPQQGADTGLTRTETAVTDDKTIARAWMTLGRRLADFRQAAGYGQAELAPLVHYSRSSLANVEVGRQKGSRDFWQACDALLDTGGAL